MSAHGIDTRHAQHELPVVLVGRVTLQAGHLLENLPILWEKANPQERHSILNGFLECVYVDLAKPGTVVGINPKPQFMGLFQLIQANSESPAPIEIKLRVSGRLGA